MLDSQIALTAALLKKAVEFDHVLKVGRTQLMDAVPILLDGSLFTAIALNPYIGYVEAARVAKIALKTGRMIRQGALSEGFITEARLTETFAADNLVGARKNSFLDLPPS